MEQNKQQTAVEWLQELYNSRPDWKQFILIEEFEQAKAMERKQKQTSQIIKVIRDGRTHLYTVTEWYSLWFLMFAFGTLVGILIKVIL